MKQIEKQTNKKTTWLGNNKINVICQKHIYSALARQLGQVKVLATKLEKVDGCNSFHKLLHIYTVACSQAGTNMYKIKHNRIPM